MSSLSSLPTELLIEIFRHLCHHCCGNQYEPEAGIQALARLCRTSKALYSVAAPILYHELPPYGAVRTFRFLLTLSVKPHLADYVRRAQLTGNDWDNLGDDWWDDWFEGVSSEEQDMLRIAFGIFGLALLDNSSNADGQEIDECHSVAMRELVSRAKFLEHVMILSYAPMEFSDREAQAWEAFSDKPDVLANLRTLERGYDYSRGGFCLSDSETSLERFIFAAAPKLERLLLDKCSEIALQSVYPAITVLKLTYSNLTMMDLTELLQRLPSLQDFAYESGGLIVGYEREGTEHTPAEVTTCLRSAAATLRRVSLDYSNFDGPVETARLVGDFSDFPVLRRLELNSSNVFLVSSALNEGRLVSMLPPSLEGVKIKGTCPPAECALLAAAAASGQFPLLKRVTFHVLADLRQTRAHLDHLGPPMWAQIWSSIRDSFRALGIVSIFRDGGMLMMDSGEPDSEMVDQQQCIDVDSN
jgi:hypothetical protein